MSLELPPFSFDQNLREVPSSASDYERFIADCKSSLQSTAAESQQALLAKLGFALRITGKLDESIVVFKRSLSLCSVNEPIQIASAKLRLAHAYQWQKKFELSNEIFEEIEFLYLNQIPNQEFKGVFWQHKGKNEFDQKRFSAALDCFNKALIFRETSLAKKELLESTQLAIQRTKDLILVNENSAKDHENDISGNFGKLHHIEIYVSNLAVSTSFWSWFLSKLGYTEFQRWESGVSFRKDATYLVFVQTEKKYLDVTFHRCRTGLNHLAFHGGSKETVDQMTQELQERGLKILYQDRHPNAGGKSYGVYFEDPDRIKVELTV